MRIGTLALIGLTLLGCAGCGDTEKPVTVPSTVTLNIPTVTPQPETKYTQAKGGLEISIAPVTYTAGIKEHVRFQQVPQPMLYVLGGFLGFCGNDPYVEQTTAQTAVVEPAQLRFLVKINNKMARVFYGKGTVVQFNVGGRLLAVEQSGYSTFLGAMVPTRQEQQIAIIGPALSSLTQPKGIIGVFLYDVVTQQDDAGKVTEKQNYEWYFDYEMQGKAVAISTVSQKSHMPLATFQSNMMRQQMEQVPQSPGQPPMLPPQAQ